MARNRINGSSATPGFVLVGYLIAAGVLAFGFYSLLQPRQTPNVGLAGYAPPPATVVRYHEADRLLAQQQVPAVVHAQTPILPPEPKPAAEPAPQPSPPPTDVAQATPERVINVKKPTRQQPSTARTVTPSRERGNPLRDYAAAYPSYSGNRPF